jgi:hypothetical protein
MSNRFSGLGGKGEDKGAGSVLADQEVVKLEAIRLVLAMLAGQLMRVDQVTQEDYVMHGDDVDASWDPRVNGDDVLFTKGQVMGAM